MKQESFKNRNGAPGPNTDEYTLLATDSQATGAGWIQRVGLERVSLVLQNSGAGTLKAYWKSNDSDYVQYWEQAVTADDGPWTTDLPDDHDLDWYVGKFDDWKLTWTNTAAVAQDPWVALMKGHYERTVTV